MPVWTEDGGSTTNYLDKQVDLQAGTHYYIKDSNTNTLFTVSEETGVVSALSGITVTGNITGNLIGNVTGNLAGNVTGSTWTGNITASGNVITPQLHLNNHIKFLGHDATYNSNGYPSAMWGNPGNANGWKDYSSIIHSIEGSDGDSDTYEGLQSSGGFSELRISTPYFGTSISPTEPIKQAILLHTPQNNSYSDGTNYVIDKSYIMLASANTIIGGQDTTYKHRALATDASGQQYWDWGNGTGLKITSGSGDGGNIGQSYGFFMGQGNDEDVNHPLYGRGIMFGNSWPEDWQLNYSDSSTYLARFCNDQDSRMVELSKLQNNGNAYYNSDGNLLFSSSTLATTFKGTLECNGTHLIKASSTANATLTLAADNSADDGDDWNFVADTTRTLYIKNNINGSDQVYLSITPNVNIADSSVTVLGNINGASHAEMGHLSGVTSAIQTQINSKQATLTFGISNNNSLKVDEETAATSGEIARFTGTGIQSISDASIKTQLSLNNVENTAISTWAGSANITTLGTIGTGTWQGTAIGDTYISSAATWNGKQAALTFGIANTNSLKVDEETTATSGEIARFTGTGIQSVSDATIKTQLSLNNVTNDAQLPLSGGTMTGDINMGANAVGFTQFEPTYNASDTEVHFDDNGNKAFTTFGAGNITDLNLYFPNFSCNCVLLLKQDTTGSRTVTNWKTFDQADGNEGTVYWAGGSDPALTTAANKLDVLSFYWDNDSHKAYGTITKNF